MAQAQNRPRQAKPEPVFQRALYLFLILSTQREEFFPQAAKSGSQVLQRFFRLRLTRHIGSPREGAVEEH